jgi:lambda repressor-like predicted transcriptional regulator
MLPKILHDDIKSKGISVREASRQIGVAHTTVVRALKGKPLDLPTIELISKWIGINPNDVLDISKPQPRTAADKLAVLLSHNPGLSIAFGHVLDLYENNQIDERMLTDILAYITFRLSLQSR